MSTKPSEILPAPAAPSALNPDTELPVVARMVVEIRSDGVRTVARGALEDVDGHRVAIDARGASPLELAMALSKSLRELPALLLPSPRAAGKALATGLVSRAARLATRLKGDGRK